MLEPTILSILDEECAHLDKDMARLAKKVAKYERDFVNKDDEHIAFFGGNLTGVHTVRFTNHDRDMWFDEILGVVEQHLADRLYALVHPDGTYRIDQNFKVRSDIMNITCAYLTHKFLTTKQLPEHIRMEAAKQVVLVMLYKFLTSLLFHYFKFPADRAVAEATYSQLSYKYELKQQGNWSAYLQDRANTILTKGSLHYHTLVDFNNELGVLYYIGDTQGRIRGMLINIYAEFIRVNKQGVRITSTSSVVEMNGEAVFKDKTRTFQNHIRYLNSVIGDRQSFIKEDLLKLIAAAVPSAQPRPLRTTLEWLSDNQGQGKTDIVGELVTDTVIYSFNYFVDNPTLLRGKRDIPGMLLRLRGSYKASRSNDPLLLSLREKAEAIVGYATGSRNETVLASVRTAILLYLILRALTMDYYSKA